MMATDARQRDPDRIYLEPPPYSPEGRLWCEANIWPLDVWPPQDDGETPPESGVEYIRADLHYVEIYRLKRELEAAWERERLLREALEMVAHSPQTNCIYYDRHEENCDCVGDEVRRVLGCAVRRGEDGMPLRAGVHQSRLSHPVGRDTEKIMGEAKRKRDRGEQPRTGERFEEGPVRVGPGRLDWAWIESDGTVRRLIISARVHNRRVAELVRDAARKRDSRIIRPVGGELVRP
ncbi:MAG TPA: hypothetical protein VF158_15970 [Longimicrobiales bacterium]